VYRGIFAYLKYFAVTTFTEDLLELKVLGSQLDCAWINILLAELYGLLAFSAVNWELGIGVRGLI